MSAPELKPCPFCGNSAYTDKATARIIGLRTGHTFAIACNSCEVSAPGSSDFNEAVTAWNTRAALCDPTQDARVRALVEALEWYAEAPALGEHQRSFDGGKRARAALRALEQGEG